MKRKRTTALFSLAMVLVLFLSFASGFSAESVRAITAYLNANISMTWDGEAFVPREADGTELEPIVYNGRTYLPAKFVADKAGVDVTWDEATKTVRFRSRSTDRNPAEPYLDDNNLPRNSGVLNDLTIVSFDLEVERGDDDDHDLDISFDPLDDDDWDDLDVEIDYEGRSDVDLEGEAALDYLLPILEDLEIDAEMSDEAIIDAVLDAFDWTLDYEDFELEVRFADGSRIDIEIGDSDDRVMSLPDAYDDLDILVFDLEVERGDDDDHDLDISFDPLDDDDWDDLDVEIDYEGRSDVNLEGEAALDYLLPILEDLEIDAEMSDEAIIDAVLDAFDWTLDYEDFELEVRFADGSRIDIEIGDDDNDDLNSDDDDSDDDDSDDDNDDDSDDDDDFDDDDDEVEED
jgi:hypothetical protein